MEISIESIEQRKDPYQLYWDHFKNTETRRKYSRRLERFLKLIPNKVFENNGVEIPDRKQTSSLAKAFVKLAEIQPKVARNIVAAYIDEDKKLVADGVLNPNTIPNHIKPIKVLLDANSLPLHWKSITRMYPRSKITEDRAYTREELQKMIEISPDITDKLIVQLFSSGGFRLESWDYFEWRDLIFFKNDDGTFQGAALLVYRGDPECYWTFITPEACTTLSHYREKWKADVGHYPKDSDPLLKSVRFPTVRRLNAFGVKRRLTKIVARIGLRPPLRPNERRYEVPLDHGFRKYFNTMLRRAKVNYLDKEDMMGHSVGLERHYERYQEEDFERFPEYQKAIPFLTISDDERTKHENEKLRKEKRGSIPNRQLIDDLQTQLVQLQFELKAVTTSVQTKYDDELQQRKEKLGID